MMPLSRLHSLHPLLTRFSLEALGIIIQSGSLIRLETDQLLYKEEDLDLKVYLIIYGTFELIRNPYPSTANSRLAMGGLPATEIKDNVASSV